MNYTDEKIDLLADMLKEIANVEISPKELTDIKAKAIDKDVKVEVKDKNPWIEKELDPYGDDYSAKRIIEEQKKYDDTEVYEITDMDIPIECNCGMEVYSFTKEQLEGMLNGKVYWADCNGGEYAHLFVMKGMASNMSFYKEAKAVLKKIGAEVTEENIKVILETMNVMRDWEKKQKEMAEWIDKQA